MTGFIVDDFDFELDAEKISKKLRIDRGGDTLLHRFKGIVNDLNALSRPKGMYRPVDVDVVGEDQVMIDNTLLKSRVLAVQLQGVHRVFPFAATCGREAADRAAQTDNVLERFWLETLLDEILLIAVTRTGEHLAAQFGQGKTAVMTPGSIDDWPLEEQKPLFSILGDVEGEIGVRLRDSFMMDPRQSISGIVFPSELDFQTCMLCDRKKCPKRRAAYDPDLFDKRFRKK